jgi:hypothetical protein
MSSGGKLLAYVSDAADGTRVSRACEFGQDRKLLSATARPWRASSAATRRSRDAAMARDGDAGLALDAFRVVRALDPLSRRRSRRGVAGIPGGSRNRRLFLRPCDHPLQVSSRPGDVSSEGALRSNADDAPWRSRAPFSDPSTSKERSRRRRGSESSSRSREAEEVFYALAEPGREIFVGFVSMGKFLQPRFSDSLSS